MKLFLTDGFLANVTQEMLFFLAGLLLVCTIIFFLFLARLLRRRGLKKTYADLKHAMEEELHLFQNTVQQEIQRIAFISQNNLYYVSLYQDFEEKKKDIETTLLVPLTEEIEGLNSLFVEKKWKGAKAKIETVKLHFIQAQQTVAKLRAAMQEVLSQEDACRQKVLHLQRRYRDVKEQFQQHQEAMQCVAASFQKIFDKMETYFAEFEELTSSAHYVEAEEKLPTMDKVLCALEDAFKKYPTLCAIVSIVLPKRLQELVSLYNEMEKNQFPMHHLKFNAQVEEYHALLKDMTQRLVVFKTDHLQKDIDIMQESIVSFFKLFDEEKEARLFFDQTYQTLYDATYDVEKHFLKLKRSLPEFKRIYQIRVEYLDQMEELQNDIATLGKTKRDLDTYVHSSLRQPYSMLVKKLHDLEKEMNRIKEVLNRFQQYLLSLKKDTEFAYQILSVHYLRLKQEEAGLRAMAIPVLEDRLRQDFIRAYQYLENIGHSIRVQPMDVEAIRENVNAVERVMDTILTTVEDASGLRKSAEESIVYANQYRQEFYDVRQNLLRAEKSFFEGDFTRTMDETVKVIRKMRPDVKQ